MFLIILGFLIIVAGFLARNTNPEIRRFTTLITIGGIGLIVLGAGTSMFKVVDTGEVAVTSLFGKVDDAPLYSGLNIVNPLVTVTPFNVKTQNYTMSGISTEGNKPGDDAIRVLTADGLEVVIDLTVLYRVKAQQAPKILRTIGTDYEDKIVRPITRTRIRDNAVYYDAVSLYSTKRAEFQDRIIKEIQHDFNAQGLELQQLLVRNIALPATVRASIESKISAEQDAQKMQFVLQKERQEADRKRVEAQGIADYQKILSTGLSDKQLQYELIQAQKAIATSPNAKVIIMNGKSTPIMVSDK